jgi:hypothetical protein
MTIVQIPFTRKRKRKNRLDPPPPQTKVRNGSAMGLIRSAVERTARHGKTELEILRAQRVKAARNATIARVLGISLGIAQRRNAIDLKELNVVNTKREQRKLRKPRPERNRIDKRVQIRVVAIRETLKGRKCGQLLSSRGQ